MGKWWASRLLLFDAGGSGICGSGLIYSLIEKTTLCIHSEFKKKLHSCTHLSHKTALFQAFLIYSPKLKNYCTYCYIIPFSL